MTGTAPSASAGPGDGTPQTVDQLLDAYHVADASADFVVVTDTSASMMDPPPIYPGAVSAYQHFADAIGANDYLSTLTFDVVPNVRFAGTLNTTDSRAQARAALPPIAAGGGTDIGAAIGAALDRLERPGAAQVQTLIFLTDGKIQVPSGSRYADPNSAAWQQLADRAHRVADRHDLVVYGAGLGGGATDINLLQKVFPRTEIVSLPAGQLPAFFSEAVERTRIERLRAPVTDDLTKQDVTVEVTPGELGSTSHLDIRFTSSLKVLGAQVVLKNVRVTSPDGAVRNSRLIGGLQTIDLGPGKSSAPIGVEVELDPPADDRVFGAETQTLPVSVNVDAEVRPEPSAILSRELGIATPVQLRQAGIVDVTRSVGIPWWVFVAALAAFVLAVLLTMWLYRRFGRTPPLHGGVELENGAVVMFKGKRTTVPNVEIQLSRANNSEVEFFTKRGKFRNGRPRIFCQYVAGNCAIASFGGQPRSLTGAQQVGPTDIVVVGQSRLRYIQSEKK